MPGDRLGVSPELGILKGPWAWHTTGSVDATPELPGLAVPACFVCHYCGAVCPGAPADERHNWHCDPSGICAPGWIKRHVMACEEAAARGLPEPPLRGDSWLD